MLQNVGEQNAAYNRLHVLYHLPVGGVVMVLAASCEKSERKTVYSTCMLTMYAQYEPVRLQNLELYLFYLI